MPGNSGPTTAVRICEVGSEGQTLPMTVFSAAASVDPNWLLSSTAQSAAAMVAIIGGFLVSRLVTLSAERNTILQRLEDLHSRRTIKTIEYEEAHDARFAVSKSWFVEAHLNNLVDNRGGADPESLLDTIAVGSSIDEMRPVVEHLVATIRTAFGAIEATYGGTSIPPITAPELRQDDLSIPVEDEGIYESVARSVSERRSPRRSWEVSLSASMISATSVRPAVVFQRQDARVARETDLRSELRFIDTEIDLTSERLTGFTKPKGITGAVLALAYLSLTGIVFPIVLMAVRPVPDNVVFRVVIVVLFVSGLVVLLGYFVVHARSLRPPKKDLQ
jgi:hypothetical protein